MIRPRLPALLFRQACLLAWIAGLLALRFPLPALVAFGLILLADWPRCRTVARLALLCVCLATGWGLAGLATPEAASAPDWATGKAKRITGRVTDVDGLPDGRLRLLLEDVRPVASQDMGQPARRQAAQLPTQQDATRSAPQQNTNQLSTPQAATRQVSQQDATRLTSSQQEAAQHTATSGEAPGTAPALPGRLAWTWESPTFRPVAGQTIEATLAIRPVRGFANPGGHDNEAYWLRRDVWFKAWSKGDKADIVTTSAPSAAAHAREWLRLRLLDRLGGPERIPPAGGIILAILFGDRFHLDSKVLDTFARTDLLHSLALSGQHLAVAGLAAALCVMLTGRLAPRAFLRVPRRKLLLLLCLPPAALYLWLGNAPPSLVRAALMLFFWVLLAFANKAGTLLDALLWALACILLIDPLSVYDLGLQLSALAVAALALSVPLCEQITAYGRRAPDAAPAGRLQPMCGPQHTATYAGQTGQEGLAGQAELAGRAGHGTSPFPPARRKAMLHRCATGLMQWRIMRALAVLAVTSTAVQAVLLPLQLLTFGRASPWFFLNLVWMPLADLVVLPFAVLALLCQTADWLQPLGDGLLHIAMFPCDVLMQLLASLEQSGLLDVPALLRPHWTSALGYGAIIIALSMLGGRGTMHPATRRLLPVAAMLLMTGPVLRTLDNASTDVQLTVFDVGQGQAVSVRTPGDRRLLVDGGGFNSPRFDSGRDLLAPALTANTSPRLDVVLNTHPDTDHLRGLLYLLESFAVHAFAHNGDTATGMNGERLVRALATGNIPSGALYAGMVLPLPHGVTVEVLHPQSPADETTPKREEQATQRKKERTGNAAASDRARESNNADSLVLRIVRNGKGLAVLCGDAEKASLHHILRSGAELEAEVLVLPHHGSASAFLPAFYDAVEPRLAIASCAAGNRYGYPAQPIREALAERGIELLTTGESGSIHLAWNDSGAMSLRTMRDEKTPDE